MTSSGRLPPPPQQRRRRPWRRRPRAPAGRRSRLVARTPRPSTPSAAIDHERDVVGARADALPSSTAGEPVNVTASTLRRSVRARPSTKVDDPAGRAHRPSSMVATTGGRCAVAGPAHDRLHDLRRTPHQALRRPRRRRRRLVHRAGPARHRLPRPERRRQVDHAARRHRPDPADVGAHDDRRPRLRRAAQPRAGRRRDARRRRPAPRPHRSGDAAPGGHAPRPAPAHRRRDARARRARTAPATGGSATTRSACASASASAPRCSAIPRC